jgi:hypothetical protein
LDYFVLEIKTKIVSHTADSKPVKQEVNGTVILPPLVFPAAAIVAGVSTKNIASVQKPQISNLDRLCTYL